MGQRQAGDAQPPGGQERAGSSQEQRGAQKQQGQVFDAAGGRFADKATFQLGQAFLLCGERGGKSAQLAQGCGLALQHLAGRTVEGALFFTQPLHAVSDVRNSVFAPAHVLGGGFGLGQLRLDCRGQLQSLVLTGQQVVQNAPGFLLVLFIRSRAAKPQRGIGAGKGCAGFLYRSQTPRALAGGLFMAGKRLAQIVAGLVVHDRRRGGQQFQRLRCRGGLAFRCGRFLIALVQGAYGGLVGGHGGVHFPGLFFQIFTGEQGAVRGADTFAGPVRAQPGELALKIFFRPSAGGFLGGQRAFGLAEAAFALRQAA